MSNSKSELTKHLVEFTETSATYEDLVVLTPRLPYEGNWGYLGQAAWKRDGPTAPPRGFILMAAEGSDALGDIVDWEPVLRSVEPTPFTTWRGVTRDPKYVCGGDFFKLGTEKPTAAETAGIRAIRRDLVSEVKPENLVWSCRLPFDTLSIYDVAVVTGVVIPTGAFVSTTAPSGINYETIPVLRVE
ncbi:hypothetical protein JR316_0013431 [Psilocybe cubensis]|uniref:Uncharacterized protein n=2 Tax=Psilocybe cubensis TaxID=181762 RepID=A0A8H7XKV4_PSICU|nr:uncharacterized protein JR316_0013431 [Psilocybe cubensis]KAH9474268.1 hypothetical protein JR316_0013431 [Psilocybe cubensis]